MMTSFICFLTNFSGDWRIETSRKLKSDVSFMKQKRSLSDRERLSLSHRLLHNSADVEVLAGNEVNQVLIDKLLISLGPFNDNFQVSYAYRAFIGFYFWMNSAIKEKPLACDKKSWSVRRLWSKIQDIFYSIFNHFLLRNQIKFFVA